MSSIERNQTIGERLDALRIDEESYDEVVTELINIYEQDERTLSRGDTP